MTLHDTVVRSVTRAHLLVQVDPGMGQSALEHIARVPDVGAVARTTGPYDVIATVDVPSERELAVVLRQVRMTPGLCTIRVCRGC